MKEHRASNIWALMKQMKKGHQDEATYTLDT